MVTVYLNGDLDLNRAGAVRDALAATCAKPGVRRCRVDLAGVSFLDSAGLGALVTALRRAREVGVVLHVANPPAMVCAVLDMTGTRAYLTAGDA